jgi:hypothetical protein
MRGIFLAIKHKIVKAIGWGGGCGERHAWLCGICSFLDWSDLEANAVFEAGMGKDLLND